MTTHRAAGQGGGGGGDYHGDIVSFSSPELSLSLFSLLHFSCFFSLSANSTLKSTSLVLSARCFSLFSTRSFTLSRLFALNCYSLRRQTSANLLIRPVFPALSLSLFLSAFPATFSISFSLVKDVLHVSHSVGQGSLRLAFYPARSLNSQFLCPHSSPPLPLHLLLHCTCTAKKPWLHLLHWHIRWKQGKSLQEPSPSPQQVEPGRKTSTGQTQDRQLPITLVHATKRDAVLKDETKITRK